MAQAHPLPLHHPWGSGVANYDITAYCQSIFSNKGYLLPSSFNYFSDDFFDFLHSQALLLNQNFEHFST